LPVAIAKTIAAFAHVIPEIPSWSKTGVRRNEQWIGNRHIDLVTCNDGYN
jgi:hypothetical protein